jgi:acetylglutamate kinase
VTSAAQGSSTGSARRAESASNAGPVIIKLGGEVVQGPHMRAIAADVAEMCQEGVPVVLVHGGGPQATELQKKLGQTPTIIGGRRVTDAETLDVMKMIVAGKMNVDLCAALLAAGAKPIGLHGASSNTVLATRRPPKHVTGGGPDPVDFGFVGDVVGVNGELLSLLIGAGYVPALACLGADASGAVYNINADAVANQIAMRLDARALVLVTDVPAVLRDVSDPASRIGRMTIAEGRRAIEEGVVTKGMIPKLEESFESLEEGVRAVHIVGRLERGDLTHAVTNPGSVGTVLVRE